MQRLFGLLRRIWDEIDEQAAAERERLSGRDARAAQILVLCAVVLTLLYFFGAPQDFLSAFGAAFSKGARLSRYKDFISHSYWCLLRMLMMTVVPLCHLRWLGERPSDFGLGLGTTAPTADKPPAWADAPPRITLRTYLLSLLLILPGLLLASFTPTFGRTYPLYRLAGRSLFELVLWEIEYASMIFALEFFFRGYLLFGLRRAFGSQALFIAMVPYCMWHFTKPWTEALGSIVAGIVLGTLALASRSIWGGVLVHVAVAWTMDFSVLLQKHALPGASKLFPP
jgi:membrane protease YdiL (CAAX protease family)